ncbi:MAG: hypothetical protein GY950_08670, partial [bacterium]|nr:hypothetical protein [bacterium]
MKKKIAAHMLLLFALLFLNAFPTNALGNQNPPDTGNTGGTEKVDLNDPFELFNRLAEQANGKGNGKNVTTGIQKFISLYTKFYHRPQL